MKKHILIFLFVVETLSSYLFSQACFSPFTTYNNGGGFSITSADFNGDSVADLAFGCGGDSVRVFLGNGNGSFGTPIHSFEFIYGCCPAVVSITNADFNSDGKIDLAIVEYNYSMVIVLLGDGTGGFGNHTQLMGVGSNPVAITSADFNGDAEPDLATANAATGNVSIFIGTGGGNFATATNFAAGTTPSSVITADFNVDGKNDVAVTTQNNVSILLGTGTGSFGSATNFAAGGNPQSITCGDFNGDAKLDLATTINSGSNISVLLGSGTGSFGTATVFSNSSTAEYIINSDFNGDGALDLATSSNGTNNISVLLGDGLGGFGAASIFAGGTGLKAIVAADFNGDMKPDLSVVNNAVGMSVLLNCNGVGIDQKAGNGQIAVHPNPASNDLYIGIENKEPATIKVYDILGNEVISTKEKAIDVSYWREGIYFVRVKTSYGVLTKKIIIQR